MKILESATGQNGAAIAQLRQGALRDLMEFVIVWNSLLPRTQSVSIARVWSFWQNASLPTLSRMTKLIKVMIARDPKDESACSAPLFLPDQTQQIGDTVLSRTVWKACYRGWVDLCLARRSGPSFLGSSRLTLQASRQQRWCLS